MNTCVTRRAAVKAILAGSTALAVSPAAAQQATSAIHPENHSHSSGVTHSDLAPFDKMMVGFIKTHHVPGGALAITRNSQLIYARGFGFADVGAGRRVEPNSLFRIASISKPLTATAVLQLAEKSKFKLTDRIFDVLPAEHWLPHRHDGRLRAITILQLLHHTAGWDRDKSFDPVGRPREVARVLNKPLPVSAADVVRYTLTLPLDFNPGSRFAYSNAGYLILGRLIEHASGQHYEDYVKRHVLTPVGISTMQLGRSWKESLAPHEVHYYDSEHRQEPAVNGPILNAKVPIVYGGENFEGFEAHGGWIASAIDLVRFASAFDHPAMPKLLNADSVRMMWSRPAGPAGHDEHGKPSDSYYGCAWNVRPVGDHGEVNTWHNGMIAGTSTLLVRRSDGLNWAVLFNTDSDPHGTVLSDMIDPLIHQAANSVRNWPDRIPG